MWSSDATARELFSSKRAQAIRKLTAALDKKQERIASMLANIDVVLEYQNVPTQLPQHLANSMAFKVGTAIDSDLLRDVPLSSLLSLIHI